jgi:SAM-dependent methyltransferase
MTTLNFDGGYGLGYSKNIRLLIPAYDALLGIASAAAAALAPEADTALVVGPGPGEELPGLFHALPKASFTLLEPSAQMARRCREFIARSGRENHCQLLEQPLNGDTPLDGSPFEVVICHNVLHLMRPDQQRQALRQLALHLAPGGLLLLSSYSHAADSDDLQLLKQINSSRLLRRGVPSGTVAWLMDRDNSAVFSLSTELLAEELQADGLEPPQILIQALRYRLWVSRRN